MSERERWAFVFEPEPHGSCIFLCATGDATVETILTRHVDRLDSTLIGDVRLWHCARQDVLPENRLADECTTALGLPRQDWRGPVAVTGADTSRNDYEFAPLSTSALSAVEATMAPPEYEQVVMYDQAEGTTRKWRLRN